MQINGSHNFHTVGWLFKFLQAVSPFVSDLYKQAIKQIVCHRKLMAIFFVKLWRTRSSSVLQPTVTIYCCLIVRNQSRLGHLALITAQKERKELHIQAKMVRYFKDEEDTNVALFNQGFRLLCPTTPCWVCRILKKVLDSSFNVCRLSIDGLSPSLSLPLNAG